MMTGSDSYSPMTGMSGPKRLNDCSLFALMERSPVNCSEKVRLMPPMELSSTAFPTKNMATPTAMRAPMTRFLRHRRAMFRKAMRSSIMGSSAYCTLPSGVSGSPAVGEWPGGRGGRAVADGYSRSSYCKRERSVLGYCSSIERSWPGAGHAPRGRPGSRNRDTKPVAAESVLRPPPYAPAAIAPERSALHGARTTSSASRRWPGAQSAAAPHLHNIWITVTRN